jgi:hypothetical protein
MPTTLKPVLALLLDALDETHAGDLDPPRANAMSALASAIIKTWTSGQLEERIDALERAAGTRR